MTTRRRSSASVRVFYPRRARDEVIGLARDRLAALAEHLPPERFVLFGSYARGNYMVASDVDLVVVYRGPRREDALALVK